MNQTTHEDFGLFRTELLKVDYITFNLTKLFQSDIEKLATYFQDLGFNSFLKKNLSDFEIIFWVFLTIYYIYRKYKNYGKRSRN